MFPIDCKLSVLTDRIDCISLLLSVWFPKSILDAPVLSLVCVFAVGQP